MRHISVLALVPLVVFPEALSPVGEGAGRLSPPVTRGSMSSAQALQRQWEPADCPEGVEPAAARCGTVRVPVRHANPDGPSLDVYVVVVPAVEPRNHLPPLLQLSGGPGLPMTDIATWYLDPGSTNYEDRRHRDVVLLDRRGTGGSSPLDCPEFQGRHPLLPKYPPDLVRSCAQRLIAQGHDLTAYSTAETVEDIDAVRGALGIARLDLWAVSAGTRLAQGYLRKYGERVRAAVLVGAVAPDPRLPLGHAASAQRALELVFRACRDDPACSAAYPDLAGDWRRLLGRLDQGPIPVTARDENGEATWTGTLERGPFGEAFREILASTGSQLRAPGIIHAAASGDFGPLFAELGTGSAGDDPFSLGLYFSVACAEGTARIDLETIDGIVAGTFLGRHRVDQQLGACAQWPTAEPPAEIFEPVEADVPVLLLAGDRDYVTPPAWAHQVARTLPRARVLVMPYGGHYYWDWGADSDAGDCFDQLTEQFWDDPDPDHLDTGCLENVEHPPFEVP